MIDVRIDGGRVVFPGVGVRAVTVGIEGERIAGFYGREEAPAAREVIDVRGAHIFPGCVDPHVHFGINNPWEEDFEIDSRAAIAGGYTTVVTFYRHARSYVSTMQRRIDAAARVSSADFAISLGVLSRQQWRELPATVTELGITSFKFYRQYERRAKSIFGVDDALELDDGDLLDFLRYCADLSSNIRVCVHCEDMAVTRTATEKLRSRSELRHTLAEFADSSPGYAEAASVLTALYLASVARSENLYVVHLSSGHSVDLLDRLAWLQEETGTIVETTGHYLGLNKHAPSGLLAMVSPPIQDEWDRERLWDAVRSGAIQSYGSDHCATRPLSKRGRSTIWEMDTGFGGVGVLLPLILTEGHHRRGIPLERLAQMTSTGPAQALGLYPKKGSMEVGGDADLTVVDLDVEHEVDVSLPNISEEYSIYQGMTLKGWPTMTMLRGRVAWDVSKGHESSRGEYLFRKA